MRQRECRPVQLEIIQAVPVASTERKADPRRMGVCLVLSSLCGASRGSPQLHFASVAVVS